MDHPIGVAGSPVSVWDRPRLLGSVAVNPVDDLGRPTQDALLYGDGNVSAVESRYLIPERSIRRDVSGDIRRHPTNIVLTGPRCETAKLMASVERGIYVYYFKSIFPTKRKKIQIRLGTRVFYIEDRKSVV